LRVFLKLRINRSSSFAFSYGEAGDQDHEEENKRTFLLRNQITKRSSSAGDVNFWLDMTTEIAGIGFLFF
jgi:hypothetical protein